MKLSDQLRTTLRVVLPDEVGVVSGPTSPTIDSDTVSVATSIVARVAVTGRDEATIGRMSDTAQQSWTRAHAIEILQEFQREITKLRDTLEESLNSI
jgi:hypothetical protein